MKPMTVNRMDRIADRCANAMAIVVVLGFIALFLAKCGVIEL